jgi:hypothetical protein
VPKRSLASSQASSESQERNMKEHGQWISVLFLFDAGWPYYPFMPYSVALAC